MESDSFWVVWNPYMNAPVVKHDTQEGATAEAERLANLQPNHKFYVLRAESVTQKVTVVTQPLFPCQPF